MRRANQADVSFHSSYYRISGAANSMTETKCQTQSDLSPVAFLVLYLTETSSTYIENAWL